MSISRKLQLPVFQQRGSVHEAAATSGAGRHLPAQGGALNEALAAKDGEEVCEAIRALIEAIALVSVGGKLAIEVRGDLAGILALASQGRSCCCPRKIGQVRLSGLPG